MTTPGKLFSQFLIGGLTVAGISYFSNSLTDTVLAGVIASIPIGMPTTIIVKDENVKGYTTNLLYMTSVLLFVTFTNWFFINKMKYSKQTSVILSLVIWMIIGVLYWLLNKGKN
jgi:hypothetical protein